VCPESGLRRTQCECKDCDSWRQYWERDKKPALVIRSPKERPKRAAVLDLIGYESNVVPGHILDLLHATHLDNGRRLVLTKFLWGNGVAPRLIRAFYEEWYRASKWKLFDSDAPKQIDTILKRLRDREIKGRGQWYFDLATRCPMSVVDGRLKSKEVQKPHAQVKYDHAVAERESWSRVVKALEDKKKKKRRRNWVPNPYLEWQDDLGWVRKYRAKKKKKKQA